MKVLGQLIMAVGLVFMAVLMPVALTTFPSVPIWPYPAIGGLLIVIGGIIASMGSVREIESDPRLEHISDQYPCPVCGKKKFTWGWGGVSANANFRQLGKIGTGKQMLARMCDNCGNVTYFVIRP